ncbi:MAG TPA: AAA family ATPase [Dongiaceae bacterium]|nr:AAA family ATPase [Dongiaceae bacterium]
MHYLFNLVQVFQQYAKANPVMAGLVGLWTAATISFIFVKTPLRVWRFFERQFTTSLTIDNSTYAYNLENFNAFLLWFQKHRFSRFSRSFTFDPTWNEDEENLKDSRAILGAGEGKHFFTYGGRFFWLTREKRTTNGTNQNNMQAYEIRITMLGRSQKKLLDLVDAFRYRYPRNKVGIYRAGKGDWSRVADAQKRPLDTVFLDEEIKQSILDDINWFLSNKQWHVDRGMPYKLTFMLWGPPGSGKSSCIKAIASHLNMNVGLINLSDMNDRALEMSFADVPKKTIIAIEDFDTTPATRSRGKLSVTDKKTKADTTEASGQSTVSPPLADGEDDSHSGDTDLAVAIQGLTLSGFLNALDGLIPLDGTIIFLTSNKIEHLDEAVVRDGRMDRKIFLGELTDPLIRKFITMLYPDCTADVLTAEHPEVIAPMMGASIYGLFGKYKNDVNGFLKALPKLH